MRLALSAAAVAAALLVFAPGSGLLAGAGGGGLFDHGRDVLNPGGIRFISAR